MLFMFNNMGRTPAVRQPPGTRMRTPRAALRRRRRRRPGRRRTREVIMKQQPLPCPHNGGCQCVLAHSLSPRPTSFSSLIPLSCHRPPHTYTGPAPPLPPRPTRALPRPPSPPPRETRARRASASLSRMLTHLRPNSAHALALPARGRHCSRTSAQPAHSRLPGPRVALTPHPRRSETPA